MSRTYVSIWNKGSRVAGPIASGHMLVALAFKFTASGKIVGFSYLRDGNDGENHYAFLLHQLSNLTVRIEASCSFVRKLPPPGGTPFWERKYIRPWLPVVVGDLYELVVHFGNGKYSNMIAARSPDPDVIAGPITVPGAASGVTNGITATTLTFLPGTSLGGAKPALDVLFRPDA